MTATILHHQYVARGAARELFQRREPEVLLSGPAGTGKSRACLEKLHAMMLRTPAARGLILRRFRVTLAGTALATWNKFVIPESEAAGHVVYYGGSAQEPAQYRYSNGSAVMVGGLDKAIKIMSSEYDVIYIQEATELLREHWEMALTRLRAGNISFQQLLADCNPDSQAHWLYQRCQSGATVMLESRHEDNPVLFDGAGQATRKGAEYLAILEALTGVRYYRLRKGLWVAAEGIIYEGFDPASHVAEVEPPPASWPRVWVVDFGFTNPFVCQAWARDPDGRYLLDWEIYQTKTLVEDHARALKERIESGSTPAPERIICDHDAEDRATLERHLGRGTQPAKKSVSDGIQAVAARLRPDGTGKPRLRLRHGALVRVDQALVDRSLPTCTADEFPGYIWADGSKEQPLKKDDHGMDCVRYLIADADLQGEANFRWLR